MRHPMHHISDFAFSRTDRFRETGVVYDVCARSTAPVSGMLSISVSVRARDAYYDLSAMEEKSATVNVAGMSDEEIRKKVALSLKALSDALLKKVRCSIFRQAIECREEFLLYEDRSLFA